MRNKIRELGRLWKSSPDRPHISDAVLNKWEKLIEAWAEDKDMPLIIRKGSQRGRKFTREEREIIVSDNTFALWIYSNVLKMTENEDEQMFTLSDMKKMLENREIPMVYALTKEERENSQVEYVKTLGSNGLSNADSKWKLCHIEPVGLNSRKAIESINIDKLVKYFKRYANPKNMFILPKEIGGLGEVQEFIDEQRYEDK